MVAAHETGTIDMLEPVRTVVAMTKVNPAIMGDNPLGKIPTLVLDDGRVIYDSLVICEYLDSIAKRPALFPTEPDRRWDALVRHSLGQGLTEALVLWRNDTARPRELQLEALLEAFDTKVTACLDAIAADLSRVEALPLDIGHIAVACALSYMDFRFADYDWRNGRDPLARWHHAFSERPSMRATVIPQD